MLKPLIQRLKIRLHPWRIRSPFRWRSIAGLLLGITIALCLSTIPAFTQESPINGRELLQQGIDRYENEQFTEAIDLWIQAQQEFTTKDDRLGQALALSNLSLAYQHLGQWEQAKQAIAESFHRLESQQDSNDRTYLEILAKASISQGHLHWMQGKSETALEAWKQAETAYCQAGIGSGVVRSWINQAQALQSLGLNRQAQEQLKKVYTLLQSPADTHTDCVFTDTFYPDLQVSGLRNLGQSLRRLGFLEQEGDQLGSVNVLQASLDLAQQFSLSDAESAVWLELGNTQRSLFEKFQTMSKQAEADQFAHKARQSYDHAATSTNTEITLHAQLNRLSLGVVTGQNSGIEDWQQIQQNIAQLTPSRQRIYAQLNLAWSLTCLQNLDIPSCNNRDRQSPETPNISPTQIAEIIANAAQTAKLIDDPAAESYALGQLGELYECTGNEAAATSLTQQALLRVEGLQFPEIRYRWEWQLGRLLRKQGKMEEAIAAYETAADSLKSVRGDLLTVNADIQFTFRDRVEPFYRQLVELLLPPNDPQAPQVNIQKALYYIEEIQLAELENFLRCSLDTLQAIPTSNAGDPIDLLMRRIDRLLQNDAALIYPILLSDRVAVLFKLPGDNTLGYYSYAIDKTTAQTTLRNLRTSLVNLSRPEDRIAASREVYQWFAPLFATHLPQHPNIQTLVFVLDGELRNIPLATLQDDSGRYLVQQNYAIVIFPSSQLFEIAASPRSLQVLGAGITQELTVADRPPFSALTGVEEEVETVSSVDPLIDGEFTQQNLQHWVDTNAFSIVHLATHGNFSSDPEDTYLLVHGDDPNQPTGELLKANDLNQLLRDRTSKSDRPLDLLVLSACETAEGDNRATLGLAGLAVRAGARSTLATLWQVSDASTVTLMEQFYRQLQQNPRSTKAQALQVAQNSLLRNPNFDNPFFWAPYILVGNWR